MMISSRLRLLSDHLRARRELGHAPIWAGIFQAKASAFAIRFPLSPGTAILGCGSGDTIFGQLSDVATVL